MTDAGPRLAKIALNNLDHDQQAVYEQIAGGRRAQGTQAFPLVDSAGGLEGPFNAMLLNPRIGSALQSLGSAIRYDGKLSPRARETAILLVARQWDCVFETYAHDAVGRQVGLDDTTLAALWSGPPPEIEALGTLDDGERLVAETTMALCRHGDLTDEQYAAAADGLGLPVLFEVLSLVGYYSALALSLRVFRVGAPD